MSEEIWHLHSALLGIHPACRKWQIAGLLIYRAKQSPRFRGDWLPHTCPRWLWTLQCWELDSTILVYVIQDYETQTLSLVHQRAALTWMTKKSFHLSRNVWWRRDRREGILQLVALPWADCRRAKDSHDLTNIDHCFQTFLHCIFSPKSCVFLKRLIIPAFSFFVKLRLEWFILPVISDSKPKSSNSKLQLLCSMGKSFLYFLSSSLIDFVSIQSFRFKIGLMTKEPFYFLPSVRLFNVFVDLN